MACIGRHHPSLPVFGVIAPSMRNMTAAECYPLLGDNEATHAASRARYGEGANCRWSGARHVERGLFQRPNVQPSVPGASARVYWPVTTWHSNASTLLDDGDRRYQVVELRDACVSMSEPVDEQVGMYNEAGLVYDARVVYDSDAMYSNRLTVALAADPSSTSPASTRGAGTGRLVCSRHRVPLGTTVQSFGAHVYHLIAETLPKVIALLSLRSRHRDLHAMRLLLPAELNPVARKALSELVLRLRYPLRAIDSATGQLHVHATRAVDDRGGDHGDVESAGAEGGGDVFLFSHAGTHHCAQRLLIAPPARRGHAGRSVLMLLRETFLRGHSVAPERRPPERPPRMAGADASHASSGRTGTPPPPRVLVVARTHTSRSRWLNQDECVAALRARLAPRAHVELFDGERQPGVLTMVSSFARADLVVGPHGSGFVGIVSPCPLAPHRTCPPTARAYMCIPCTPAACLFLRSEILPWHAPHQRVIQPGCTPSASWAHGPAASTSVIPYTVTD